MMMLNEQCPLTPTPERFENGDLILSGKVWQKKYKAHVDALGAAGCLGGWRDRAFRLNAAEMLYSDWVGTEYNPRIISDITRPPGSGSGAGGGLVDRMTRRDRYDYVMRKIGAWAWLVRWFVVEERNAAELLQRQGVSQPGRRHYRMVWRELCFGLDALAAAYLEFFEKYGSLKGWEE
jgi:hypothetical protein